MREIVKYKYKLLEIEKYKYTKNVFGISVKMTARVRGIVGSNPITPDAFISSKFKYKYKLKRKSKYKYKFEGKSKYKYNRKCVYMALWGLSVAGSSANRQP